MPGDTSTKTTPASTNGSFEQEVSSILEVIALGDHYRVLGVPRSATREEIKAAYYDLVRRFHPDRNRDSAVSLTHLSKILDALTRAAETLGRKKTRAEYDEKLCQHDPATARQSLPVPPASSTALSGSRPAIPAAPRTPNQRPTQASHSRLRATQPPQESQPPLDSSGSQERARPSRAPATTARRARLAAALTRGRSVPPSSSEVPRSSVRPSSSGVPQGAPATQRTSVSSQAPAEETDATAIAPSAQRYLNMAEQAARDGQWSSAVNALRLALEFNPENPTLLDRLARYQHESDRSQADRHLAQAQHDESIREYAAAAHSFERAARGKRSAKLYAEAARCQLIAEGDIRKAVELARSAIKLAPEASGHHLILAQALQTAGMLTSAIAEAKRALKLAPQDARARDLLKKLKAQA